LPEIKRPRDRGVNGAAARASLDRGQRRRVHEEFLGALAKTLAGEPALHQNHCPGKLP
jgi:hypothetical protein